MLTDAFQDVDAGFPSSYRFDGKLLDLRRLQAKFKVQTDVVVKLLYADDLAENAKSEETRIDVYETLCPQQMLVHKGGKIKNWGGECRDVTPTKSLSQNIRVDVNREVKFL